MGHHYCHYYNSCSTCLQSCIKLSEAGSSVLGLVELCFDLGQCQNGILACGVVESGLGSWDIAFDHCFSTKFSPQFFSWGFVGVCQKRQDHAIIFSCEGSIFIFLRVKIYLCHINQNFCLCCVFELSQARKEAEGFAFFL